MANTSQIVHHETFDGRGFTDVNSLSNALMSAPDELTPVITHLAGKESNKFPLHFLTAGQEGGTKYVEMNNIQYHWPVIKRLVKSDFIVSSTYTTSDKPGLGGSELLVTFKTNWLKNQYIIVGEDTNTQLIVRRRTQVGGGHWQYALVMANPTPTGYVDPSLLTAGKKWAMSGGAPVAEAHSTGNESNVVMPGRRKNQLSILRKSFHIGGNLSNKTVEFKFNVDGTETNYWLPFEEWQHHLNWMQDNEEHCWFSQYNRLADGSILLKDPETGYSIPIGGGIDYQIPTEDTYATLTYNKLKTILFDIFHGATDTGKMEIVLYCGEGFADDFDTAMKDEASTFTVIQGGNQQGQFIQGTDNQLTYGGYFTSYKHIDGHVITLKRLPLLDYGGRALVAAKHPRTGKPITSHSAYFVDQSIYDGKRNVQMATERGRMLIRGVEQGMALYKGKSYGDYSGNPTSLRLSTEKDATSIHMLSVKGTPIRRNTHCFKLTCNLS